MGSDPDFPDDLERRVRELEANQDVMSNDIADLRARDEAVAHKKIAAALKRVIFKPVRAKIEHVVYDVRFTEPT